MENVSKKPNNPWKGLQSYQENDVIYGRDEEIKALYTRILYNTQTVVYGKSGIGKSSIINAGIIPRAKYDGMLPVSIRLAHTTKKEQTAPYVDQIFNRIKEEVEKIGGELEEITPHNIDHEESLWELLHRFRFWESKGDERKRVIPLLLFDQFEEIFTLEISSKRVESFFSELADLLNEIKPTYLTPSCPKYNSSLHVGDNVPKTRNVFTNLANRKRDASPEYLEKSDFHIVITLREDFLSYLERYTVHIPVMKQNRFPILPINEEQAAKIITEPINGLIQLDVAEMIIRKVTGRNDFKLDGIPEIEVNAALLSLYMEQLYERKGEDVLSISSELVVQCSDDIIKNFYESSVEDINAIDSLEDELITNADKRDNVARVNLISKGISEDDLDKLIDRKVLSQFSYNGDWRIELIHDILCPIVNNRIEHREQLAKEKQEEIRRQKEKAEEDARIEKERLIQEEKLKKAEVEKQLLIRKQKIQEEENNFLLRKKEEERRIQEREKEELQKKVKRNRLYFWLAIILAVIASPLIYNYAFPPEQWQLLLVEDQTVGSENYWKAEVSILSETADTLYPVQVLDKAHSQTAYPTHRVGKVRVVVQFLAGNFNTIDTLMNMSDSLFIPISRAYGRKRYEGRVVYGQSPGQPLKNAVVIIGNQITRTNHKGAFTAYVEQNDISDDGTIIVFKNGYTLLNTKFDENAPYYKLQPEDSKAFEKRLSLVDKQLVGNSFEMTGEIAGSPCHLKGCLKNDSIYGYYYYDSSVQQEKDLKYAKIVFFGKLSSDKTFHLDCCDWVYNIEELNGKINEDDSWEGYWHSYSPNLQKFKFVLIDQ